MNFKDIEPNRPYTVIKSSADKSVLLEPYLTKILSDYSATSASLYLQECQQKQQRVERYHESKRFNHH